MINIREILINNGLNGLVEEAIRGAVKLQDKANKEYKKQLDLQAAGEKYDFTLKHSFEEGVSAVCQVLWKVFGGYPYQSIQAIRDIVDDNDHIKCLGYDSSDYIKLFLIVFKG